MAFLTSGSLLRNFHHNQRQLHELFVLVRQLRNVQQQLFLHFLSSQIQILRSLLKVVFRLARPQILDLQHVYLYLRLLVSWLLLLL